MITTSNDEHVGLTSGERISLPVLDGDNGEGSIMFLEVNKLTNTSSIVSLGHHYHGTHLELENIRHLAGGDIHLNGVVDLDIRVRVTKGASVVGDSNRDLLRRDVDLLDAAQLVLGLGLINTVKNETSLGIIKETEAIARLLELNGVHESSRVVEISPDLSVNLDATFHADLLALLSGQGVLKTLTKDNGNGEALALLVGTGRGLGCPDTGHLGHVPMARRIKALEVLLRTANHDE